MNELKPRIGLIKTRLSSHSVVYDKRICGRRLQAERAQHYRDNPLCHMCEAEGVVRVWEELDHVTALVNGGSDSGPKQGLCKHHHKIKTAADLASAAGRNG